MATANYYNRLMKERDELMTAIWQLNTHFEHELCLHFKRIFHAIIGAVVVIVALSERIICRCYLSDETIKNAT